MKYCCNSCTRPVFEHWQTRSFFIDEKPFSCKYCQTQFRRKDNLNRHIRHHHSEESSCSETNNKVPPVVKADRSCSMRSSNQQPRQRQKSRKIQPKSPGKVASISTTNSHQINSRLDPMGNITPVIRTTAEVSNAVSVINGPISTGRLEERTCKKMFTYMEPIPIAEAAVINCRIQEKLYPQSASSHNYFVHNYRNIKVNSYPNNDNDNQLEPRENSISIATIFTPIESFPSKATISHKESTSNICGEKYYQNEDKMSKADECTRGGNGNSESKDHTDATSLRDCKSNYVSTIKKHTVQQSDGNIYDSSASSNSGTTTNHYATLPKDFQDSDKRKQSDVHWRRRTAETLKPCK